MKKSLFFFAIALGGQSKLERAAFIAALFGWTNQNNTQKT